MPPFRLGFLTHVSGPSRRDLLAVFGAAEEFGFDGGWVAQPHAHPDFGRLSPSLAFLGAAAGRTSRLRLGTALTVQPLQDPVRLAEDAAVLDTFADSRLELGLGAADGLLFDDHLTTLRTALDERTFTADALTDRLWQCTADPAQAELIGRQRDGLLLGLGSARLPVAEAYLTGWQTGRGPGAPRLGIVCGLSIGDTVEELRADPALKHLTPESWLLPVVRPGQFTVRSVIDRLRVLATEVAPALGWQRDIAG